MKLLNDQQAAKVAEAIRYAQRTQRDRQWLRTAEYIRAWRNRNAQAALLSPVESQL